MEKQSFSEKEFNIIIEKMLNIKVSEKQESHIKDIINKTINEETKSPPSIEIQKIINEIIKS